MRGRRPNPTTPSPAIPGLLAILLAAFGPAACEHEPSGAAAIPVALVVGELGQSPGQFIYPRALDCDGSSLWVIDKSGRVQRLDPATGDPICGWSMPDSALGKPVGITIAPDQQGRPAVYIPDTHYHRVLVYRAPSGMGAAPELLREVGEFGEGPGQFIYPTDVAVLTGPGGSLDRIFVAEYGGNDRINVFDGAFAYLFSFGGPGASADPGTIQFDRPESIAIEPSMHELIVVDSSNHRIGRFTLDGSLVAWIGSPETAGNDLGQFRYPYGLYLPGDGTALISEFGNNRVQQIDLRTGDGLAAWGRGGRGDGEVITPWAVTALGDRAYVLDSGNNRILAFPAPRPRKPGGGGHG